MNYEYIVTKVDVDGLGNIRLVRINKVGEDGSMAGKNGIPYVWQYEGAEITLYGLETLKTGDRVNTQKQTVKEHQSNYVLPFSPVLQSVMVN